MSNNRSLNDVSPDIRPHMPADWPPDLLAQFSDDLRRLCTKAGCAGTYRVQGTGGRRPRTTKTSRIIIGDAIQNGVQILTLYGEDDDREVWVLHRQPHEKPERLRQRLIDALAALPELQKPPSEQPENGGPPVAPAQAGVAEGPPTSCSEQAAELERLVEGLEALESEAAEIDSDIVSLRELMDEAQARKAGVSARLDAARKARAKLEAARKIFDES